MGLPAETRTSGRRLFRLATVLYDFTARPARESGHAPPERDARSCLPFIALFLASKP